MTLDGLELLLSPTKDYFVRSRDPSGLVAITVMDYVNSLVDFRCFAWSAESIKIWYCLFCEKHFPIFIFLVTIRIL